MKKYIKLIYLYQQNINVDGKTNGIVCVKPITGMKTLCKVVTLEYFHMKSLAINSKTVSVQDKIKYLFSFHDLLIFRMTSINNE